MILGFGNNVVSSLASDITSSQTNISVIPGDGSLFAALLTSDFNNSSATLKNYAKITLTDSGETAFEVCHLIAVSGDTLTVVRGQEGTTAKGWSLKDVIANFATRGSENQFVQIEQLQSGTYTSCVSGGSANALTIELPATYFVNSSTDWALRVPIVVYPTQNNTGASTLQLVMGGRVLGTFPLYKGNKAQLVANDILKDVGLVCLMDKTKTFFNVANPGAIYAGLGTAAFKDVVTSMTDATAGRVPVVGWMGLGADSISMSNGNILSPTSIGNALFRQDGGNNANHFGDFGAGVHLSCGSSVDDNRRLTANLFVDSAGNLSVEWLSVNKSDGAIVVNHIQKLYGPLNKPTSDTVDAIMRDECHIAGFVSGNEAKPYMRHTASNAVVQLLPITTADNRYIQNTQMGAEEYVDIPYPGQADLPLGACPTAYVGTTKSTGSGISFHISRVYFRRLQKYIGGSWVNVA